MRVRPPRKCRGACLVLPPHQGPGSVETKGGGAAVRASGQSDASFIRPHKVAQAILFNLRDPKEVVQTMKWFFGAGPRPRYGRFTYWEKFDYFAVFWGIMVIGSTGFVLWFPELFTWILPGWGVNVATIIHSDEALLAVGFIFTIHFFNTHLRPEKFPMDPVIFTGRMRLKELRLERPDHYAELLARGELEARLVDPVPPHHALGVRVFAYGALLFGVTFKVLMVYLKALPL